MAEMNPKKAPGLDGIEIALLQQLPDVAKRRLLHLINRSFTKGEVPAKWRVSMLISIPKPRPDRKFRPISLTSVIARTAERMVYKVFMKWLQPFLPHSQAGFRMHRSTEEQIEALCEGITHEWNKKRQTMAIFCDLSAAYDRVPHHNLLVKLGNIKCPTFLWRWIRAFIMDRRWRCRWNTALSSERVVPQGLPQGGPLSPSLWIARKHTHTSRACRRRLLRVLDSR